MGKWLYYNLDGGSFHTKKLCSRLYSTVFVVWATLWELRGKVRTPSIARLNARGRLYIRHNGTFFAISYGWDVLSGNLSTRSRRFSKGVGRFERNFQTVGVRKSDCPFVLYQNIVIGSALLGFVTKHACDRHTDRRTHRITTAIIAR